MPVRPLSTLILALSLVASASAGIPHTLQVQGRLQTSGGAPVTDPTTLTIRVHDADSGGNTDYTEVDVVIPDSEGVFATVLGDGGSLDSSLFEDPRWLSFEIDSEGEMAPRQAVLPVPSALRAESAATLAPTTTVSMGGEALTGLPAPSAAGDAANKGFVDAGDAALQGQLDTLDSDLDAHEADASIHFTQGSIVIQHAQVSDFDSGVSTSTHALDGSVHFSQAAIAINASQVTDFDAKVSVSTHAGDANNPHGVTRAQVGLGDVPNLKQAVDGTKPPLATDDGSEGYAIGSRYFDIRSGTSYDLVDLTGPGAAVWRASSGSRYSVHISPVVTTGGIHASQSGDLLETALANITDATTDRWTQVVLEPGTYEMDVAQTLPGYVRIVGAGAGVTKVRVASGTTTLRTTGVNLIEDLTLEGNDPSSDLLEVESTSELTLRGVEVAASYTGGSRTAIRVKGALLMQGGSVEISTAGSGLVHAVETVTSIASVRLEGVEVSVPQAVTTRALYGSLGKPIVMNGGKIDVSTSGDGHAVYVSSSAEGVHLDGVRVDVVSSGGGAVGVEGFNGDCSVSGSDIVAQGATEASGAQLFCDDSSLVNSTRIHLTGHTTASVIGIYVGATSSLSEVTGCTVIGTSTSTGTMIGLRGTGGRFSASGNVVKLSRTGAAAGSSYGLYLTSDGGGVAGTTIELSTSSSGTTRGVYLSDSNDFSLSALHLTVTAPSTAYGIYMATGGLTLSSSDIVLDTTGGTAYGIRCDNHLLVNALKLHVDNTGGDAIGIDADPSSTGDEWAVVSGSFLDITASGTAYLADATTDGTQTPDLTVMGSNSTATTRGTDVDCVSSSCPP